MDKKQAMREAMQFQLIQEFAQIDGRTREERVDRYLEIDRQKIISEQSLRSRFYRMYSSLPRWTLH